MGITIGGTALTIADSLEWGTETGYCAYKSNVTSTSYYDISITSTSYGSVSSATYTVPDASGVGDELYGMLQWQGTGGYGNSQTFVTPYVDGVAGSEVDCGTGTNSSPYYNWTSAQYPLGSWVKSSSNWNTTPDKTGTLYTGTGGDLKIQARYSGAGGSGGAYLAVFGYYCKKSVLDQIFAKECFVQGSGTAVTRYWKLYMNKIQAVGFPTNTSITMDGATVGWSLNNTYNNTNNHISSNSLMSQFTTTMNTGGNVNYPAPNNWNNNYTTWISAGTTGRMLMEGTKFTASVT